MVANSSTLAFCGSNGADSAPSPAGAPNRPEDKPDSFENLLGQARNQRVKERPGRQDASLRGPSSRSVHSSPQSVPTPDQTVAETAPDGDYRSGPAHDTPAPFDNAPQTDQAKSDQTDTPSSAPCLAPVAGLAQNVSAVIALSCLAPPAAGVTIVPQATAAVQSQEISKGISPEVALVTPGSVSASTSQGNTSTPTPSGNLSDSHPGLSTGSGEGNVTSLSKAGHGATPAPQLADLTLPAATSPASPTVPVPSVPLAAGQVETQPGPALPAGARGSTKSTLEAPANRNMSNETQSDNGSKFNGIERLFVVKQEANTQSAAADSQLQVAALNVRGTSSNGASAQPAHSSGIAGPPNSPVPHGDETSASAAFSPVTIDSDLLVPALAASVGNENAAITNSLQGAPARETGSKGDLPVASVASDHPAASGPRHQAISSQNPGADTNDTRDNQQDTEQSPGPQTHAEMLPPSADAVHPPVSNASGSISLEGPTSTAASQNLERYHVVEQVTRHLDSLRLKNGHGDITLNLMPAHLGSVKVTISTSEHGVVARVLVETSQAQQAMESAKDSLRSALESRGLNLSSLDVSLGQNMPGDSWGNFARQQERAREATERIAGRDYNRSGAADTVPEVVAAAGILNRATGSSRLDYRA